MFQGLKSAVQIGALACALTASSFSAQAISLDVSPLSHDYGSVTLGNSTAPFDFTLTAKDILANKFRYRMGPGDRRHQQNLVSVQSRPQLRRVRDLHREHPVRATRPRTAERAAVDDAALQFRRRAYPRWFGTLLGNGARVDTTPLPGALPLFVTGLGALGLLAHRRRKRS